MKRDAIDRLLQLAFLEGTIGTRGAYETSAARKPVEIRASESSRVRLQERLASALGGAIAPQDVPLTVGLFLKGVRSEGALQPQDVVSRLGLSQNIYRMLEHDRISPLKISAEIWKMFRRLFNLPVDEFVEMVRRTHQLVFFRPSFRTTLARYDARKQKGMKASALEQAAVELYTKAQLSLPPEEESKLDALLRSISQDS